MALFRRKDKAGSAVRQPGGPPGARAYAIGDVHGRLDLLHDLLERIDDDSRRRPCEGEFIVFLGDLIDRGPDSAGVIQLLRGLQPRRARLVFIMGNHEEMLLRVLGAESDQFRDWLRFGGYECAQSYGVAVGRLATLAPAAAAAEVRAAIPPADIAFLESFVDSFRFGDYLFVHAGIRPGIALEKQTISDLRWIREDFLRSPAKHAHFVVHGHTISEVPDEQPNRIGIDTGAYASGILTAICLEGTSRKYLSSRT